MKRFEKITKRYALANSYFKNRRLIWPYTLCEIHDYLQQHGELPFRYDGDNWSYDALCERQKRRGVRLSQYLTPDATPGGSPPLPCGISRMTAVSWTSAAVRDNSPGP